MCLQRVEFPFERRLGLVHQPVAPGAHRFVFPSGGGQEGGDERADAEGDSCGLDRAFVKHPVAPRRESRGATFDIFLSPDRGETRVTDSGARLWRQPVEPPVEGRTQAAGAGPVHRALGVRRNFRVTGRLGRTHCRLGGAGVASL